MAGVENRNAAVGVSYRKKGTTEWKKGLPLMRLNGERIVHKAVEIDYIAQNMFAGSIFDLEPGGTYECRFVLSDPDSVKGKATQLVTVTTRNESKAFTGGRTFHVYPPDYKGAKQEPACEGIMEAYYSPRPGALAQRENPARRYHPGSCRGIQGRPIDLF